jgi:hypothetical protein
MTGGAIPTETVEKEPNTTKMEVNTTATVPNNSSTTTTTATPRRPLISKKMKSLLRQKFIDGIDLLVGTISQFGPSLVTLLCLSRFLSGDQEGLSFLALYAAALLGASCGFSLFLYFITLGYALGVTFPLALALIVYNVSNDIMKCYVSSNVFYTNGSYSNFP